MGLRNNGGAGRANIALSGARATRDARDASEFGALVPRYEKFESISLQGRVRRTFSPSSPAANGRSGWSPVLTRARRFSGVPLFRRITCRTADGGDQDLIASFKPHASVDLSGIPTVLQGKHSASATSSHAFSHSLAPYPPFA